MAAEPRLDSIVRHCPEAKQSGYLLARCAALDGLPVQACYELYYLDGRGEEKKYRRADLLYDVKHKRIRLEDPHVQDAVGAAAPADGQAPAPPPEAKAALAAPASPPPAPPSANARSTAKRQRHRRGPTAAPASKILEVTQVQESVGDVASPQQALRPEKLPAGWRAIEQICKRRKLGQADTYTRYESEDGRHSSVKSVKRAIELDAQDRRVASEQRDEGSVGPVRKLTVQESLGTSNNSSGNSSSYSYGSDSEASSDDAAASAAPVIDMSALGSSFAPFSPTADTSVHRICAKSLVRSGFRCVCHYKPKWECPSTN